MLLTNLALKRTRKSLWFVVGGYLTRWWVEEAIRVVKQSYRFGRHPLRLAPIARLRHRRRHRGHFGAHLKRPAMRVATSTTSR